MKYFWWGLGIFIVVGYVVALVVKWRKHQRSADLWNQIIEGTVSNMELLSKETADLSEDWSEWTFEQRKQALFDTILGELLKDDSDRERSSGRAHWFVDMLLDSNPELKWDQHIYALLISRRMELAKRAARKARKSK